MWACPVRQPLRSSLAYESDIGQKVKRGGEQHGENSPGGKEWREF